METNFQQALKIDPDLVKRAIEIQKKDLSNILTKENINKAIQANINMPEIAKTIKSIDIKPVLDRFFEQNNISKTIQNAIRTNFKGVSSFNLHENNNSDEVVITMPVTKTYPQKNNFLMDWQPMTTHFAKINTEIGKVVIQNYLPMVITGATTFDALVLVMFINCLVQVVITLYHNKLL